ncbi:PREDICTED: mucin-1 isoform X25 [Colobus angolensis palliatus]|uniref:SEA domain-containing protein n=1 Tax=Colobus angolensis palliatus TaxID=336983 RepID=A0A2K5K2B1_COLAP|nr:PREDICTED: mucin-1 isoform X25 [Colobus angolensis palliatus]
MTPGTQSPFFLLLILTVLTAATAPESTTVVIGFGHTSSIPGGEKETSATQRSSMPISTKNAFNSSLEDPSTNYYQQLQRDISELSGAGVPGWGIALLVLVCVLVVLAIVYFIALAVCQCRQKNYRQLDIFPARDAYHPMSEYPTYHTHGRYVPPGSTNRSPYEEVSAGNGGSSLSYTNPAVAATSANL